MGEKLRGVGQGQTIKLQTIQTNPQTGAKQIIAIPIQAAATTSSGQGARLSVSPLKVVRSNAGVSSAQYLGVSSGHTLSSGGHHTLTSAGHHALSSSGHTLAISSGQHGIVSSGAGITSVMAGSSAPTRTVMIGSPRVAGGSGQVSLVKPQNFQNVQQVHSVHQVQNVQQVQSVQQVQAVHQILTPHKMSENSANNQNYISPILDHSGTTREGRKRVEIDFDSFGDTKRRKTEKGGKGLRHFSMKVCEKVQAKGSTSYNEVADELVAELTDPRCQSPTDQQYDQKNIRRRVYDALNVLMAMNIISKEKKEIRWLGLPTNSVQEAYSLETDKAKRIERIKAKTQQLQELILQHIAFKNLVERNKEAEKTGGSPTPNSIIQTPFIIINTSKKTIIDCRISNDKMEYLFNFDNTFEIHDDMEVLKRMGMAMGLEEGSVSAENLMRARNMVPRALEQYVVQLAQHGPGSCAMPKVTAPVVMVKADPGSDPEEEEDLDPEDSDVDIN